MIEELRALADQMDDFGTQPWRGLLLAIVEKYEDDCPPTISDDDDWIPFPKKETPGE